jgi:hypothetical protein
MWAAWWLTFIGVVINVLMGLVGLRQTYVPPMPTPVTPTSGDQINAMLLTLVVAALVFALITLVVCWVLSGFGYWIAGPKGADE